MITEFESIPKKSSAYLFGQSPFFAQFNDVDFYVEDEGQESFYLVIISKLICGIKLDRIYPLGGKKALLEHEGSNVSSRKSIYIVDKDFDDLLNKKRQIKRLIYLDRYSIENYLLESDAVVRFIISCNPKLNPQKIRQKLNISDLIQDVIKELRRLCLLFFLAQLLEVQNLANAASPIARFTKDKVPDSVCEEKVAAYEAIIRNACEEKEWRFSELVNDYSSDFEFESTSSLVGVNICGKALLDIVRSRIAKCFCFNCQSRESTAYRLAEYCEFKSLDNLRNFISELMGV